MSEQGKKRQSNNVARIKMIIIGFFVLGTILPIISACVLLVRVQILENKVKALTGADQWIFQSSNEALMSNPNLELTDDSNGTQTEGVKRVYLTFDDGPSIYTGQILDILKMNDVKATFFVIGREDEKYWPYYKRIVDEGHTLGMHSFSHKYDEVYASLDSFEADVEHLSAFLYDRTGQYPTIYRFPGGSSNTVSRVDMNECIGYLNEQHIQYYDWNAMNGDAVTEELSPDRLVQNVMDGVHKNDVTVVLMHDMQSRHNTVESLQTLINILKDEGYEILPIDENTPLIQHRDYDAMFEESNE